MHNKLRSAAIDRNQPSVAVEGVKTSSPNLRGLVVGDRRMMPGTSSISPELPLLPRRIQYLADDDELVFSVFLRHFEVCPADGFDGAVLKVLFHAEHRLLQLRRVEVHNQSVVTYCDAIAGQEFLVELLAIAASPGHEEACFGC